MRFFRKSLERLDPDDPRRWEEPTEPFRLDLWKNNGVVVVSLVEVMQEDEEAEKCRKAEELNNSRPFKKRKIRAKRLAYPSCIKGVHAQQPYYTHTSVRSCNCCGITHWRRHCPIRDQEFGSDTSPESAADGFPQKLTLVE
uniref:uncharacterized protein LOC105351510 n=1 Tax=Fragaria vesca subsp. vesca TaxID=101020 RepID=UPI0005CA87FC|nr:PREDICTED: uncharacterized protein LOC105351510 [Fragaria vesca subsp. vesca]